MMRTTNPEIPELLSQRQLAARLGVTTPTLERWRETGDGPAFIRVGRLCRYRTEDVAVWLAARRCTSTSNRIAGGEAR